MGYEGKEEKKCKLLWISARLHVELSIWPELQPIARLPLKEMLALEDELDEIKSLLSSLSSPNTTFQKLHYQIARLVSNEGGNPK